MIIIYMEMNKLNLNKDQNNIKESIEVSYVIGGKSFKCPVALTSSVINGKWKLQILNRLSIEGILRFGELKKRVPKVSEKMLIQHLKELELDEMIYRKVYQVVPPKVEYTLTAKGKAFIPIIDAMREWGNTFCDKSI